MNDERIKLFSDSDLDGISCGIVGKIVFNENIDIDFCTPKDINTKIVDFVNSKEYEKYDKVFITDLVIKEETASLINSINNFKFKLFDHHRSNYAISKYSWTTVSENYNGHKSCGTELFWEHLKEYYIKINLDVYHGLDNYVEYVRLFDTWEWTEAGEKGIYAKNLNTLLNVYSKTRFMNLMFLRMIQNLCSDNIEFISERDMEILKTEEYRKNRYIKQKVNNVRSIEINNMKIGYVFAESYISELGNYIIKNYKDIDFVAIINSDTRVVSLRAAKNSNIDLSEIVKIFSAQGGGHPSSAGFVYDKICEEINISNIFKYENDVSK